MYRIAFIVVAVLFALPAMAATFPNSTAHSKGKSRARKMAPPVAVDAEVGSTAARVSLTFYAPATDVEVRVHGVDGMKVTSEPRPLVGESFGNGEKIAFDVSYSPGEGRSLLVVSVAGKFGGVKQSSVTSYAVGVPTAAQKRKGAGVTVTDGAGRRLRDMPE